MPLRVYDDRGRELLFIRPPRRIVSLVPSDTLNVFALGAGDRLVGRTRYCVAPEQAQQVPVVGGTKDVDVDAVARLEPDLVLANQEENSRPHVERLAQLQLPVFVAFPRRVGEGLGQLLRDAVVGQAAQRPAQGRPTGKVGVRCRGHRRGTAGNGVGGSAAITVWCLSQRRRQRQRDHQHPLLHHQLRNLRAEHEQRP